MQTPTSGVSLTLALVGPNSAALTPSDRAAIQAFMAQAIPGISASPLIPLLLLNTLNIYENLGGTFREPCLKWCVLGIESCCKVACCRLASVRPPSHGGEPYNKNPKISLVRIP